MSRAFGIVSDAPRVATHPARQSSCVDVAPHDGALKRCTDSAVLQSRWTICDISEGCQLSVIGYGVCRGQGNRGLRTLLAGRLAPSRVQCAITRCLAYLIYVWP